MRTTSTSFITGTGLKKWSPTNWSGRWVNMAIWVMVSDEVLLAKMRLRLHRLVEGGEGLPLLVQVLDDRLDHDVAVGERRRGPPCRRGGRAPRRGPRPRACPSPPPCRASRWILLEPLVHQLLADLAHHRLVAGAGRDLGDARSPSGRQPRTPTFLILLIDPSYLESRMSIFGRFRRSRDLPPSASRAEPQRRALRAPRSGSRSAHSTTLTPGPASSSSRPSAPSPPDPAGRGRRGPAARRSPGARGSG